MNLTRSKSLNLWVNLKKFKNKEKESVPEYKLYRKA